MSITRCQACQHVPVIRYICTTGLLRAICVCECPRFTVGECRHDYAGTLPDEIPDSSARCILNAAIALATYKWNVLVEQGGG